MSTELERLGKHNIGYAVGLAKELHGLGAFGQDGPAFDWDYCKGTMERSMYEPTAYFTLARDDTGYVGAVVGRVVPFYFSPSMLGLEEAWYVREGTPARAAVGMKLMRAFVNWCIYEKHAQIVQSGDVAGIRTVGVDAIYRKLGFERFGVIYKFARKS